jgi:6-phosphogluconolactonase
MTLPVHFAVSADPSALAHRAAAWLLDLALAKTGPFHLCLSGGSTPKALYGCLAEAPYKEAFPWSRTQLWWGDERFVAPDDPLSNYRMVRETLLDKAPIPEANVHPMPTERLSPEAAAQAYEAALKGAYGADRLDENRPLFDVVLLGLGPDGHTASLFPGAEVLNERNAWVSPVVGVKAEARLTLTYPALESSASTAFLVAGEDKKAILSAFSRGASIPAAALRPRGGLWVFCDAAARGAQD